MKLIDLPPDVILHLIASLDPLDILSLGQTCWAFRGLCDERAVWSSAVRRTRAENAIFPAFLHPEQTASIFDLRREATAPGRFVSLLKRANETGQITPNYTRYHFDSDVTINFCLVNILPGGRVLMTGSNKSLSIWEIPDERTQNLRLIHQWEFKVIAILAVVPGPNNNLRIVATSPRTDRLVQLGVFEYDFSTLTSTLDRRSDITFYELRTVVDGIEMIHSSVNTLSGDSFYYTLNGALYAWNFVLDVWQSWHIDGHDYEEIIVPPGSNLVILISCTNIYGYYLERAHPSQPSSYSELENTTLTPLTPTFTMEIPDLPPGIDLDSYSGECEWRRQAAWYDASSSHFAPEFDIVSRHDDDAENDPPGCYSYSSYRIRIPLSEDSPGCVESVRKGWVWCDKDEEIEILPSRKCQDWMINLWRCISQTEDHPPTMQLAFPHAEDPPPGMCAQDIEVELGIQPPPYPFEHEEEKVYEFSLDPVSGRLCYINTVDGAYIGILDYLPL